MPLARDPGPRVVGAVMAARVALQRAADRLVPSPFALFDHANAFTRTAMLAAVVETGIADALAARPQTARELGQALALDEDAVHRVLRALVAPGIVRLGRGGRFRLTRVGRHLASSDPDTVAPWLGYMASASTQAAWHGLARTLRTGEPSFPAVHGRSVWTWFADHPEEERRFAESMRRVTEYDVPAIVGGYPWPERGVVADVAGGVGTVLAAVLAARPALRGVLIDAPGVLEEADGYLRCAGVRDRVELRAGDVFSEVEAQADLYVLKDVLHDWGDPQAATILATVRAAMAPGARVVIVERLQERDVPDPLVSWIDVQMLTQCDGGRQRSAAELHALMRSARIEPGDVRATGGPALVEGRAVG